MLSEYYLFYIQLSRVVFLESVFVNTVGLRTYIFTLLRLYLFGYKRPYSRLFQLQNKTRSKQNFCVYVCVRACENVSFFKLLNSWYVIFCFIEASEATFAKKRFVKE